MQTINLRTLIFIEWTRSPGNHVSLHNLGRPRRGWSTKSCCFSSSSDEKYNSCNWKIYSCALQVVLLVTIFFIVFSYTLQHRKRRTFDPIIEKYRDNLKQSVSHKCSLNCLIIGISCYTSARLSSLQNISVFWKYTFTEISF